jgi:hypothetical protein
MRIGATSHIVAHDWYLKRLAVACEAQYRNDLIDGPDHLLDVVLVSIDESRIGCDRGDQDGVRISSNVPGEVEVTAVVVLMALVVSATVLIVIGTLEIEVYVEIRNLVQRVILWER